MDMWIYEWIDVYYMDTWMDGWIDDWMDERFHAFMDLWMDVELYCGTGWRLGWVDYFQPEGRGFDSCSSRHVGTFAQGPYVTARASPLTTVACALRRETPIQYPCCSRERLWVVEDLKGRYRNE